MAAMLKILTFLSAALPSLAFQLPSTAFTSVNPRSVQDKFLGAGAQRRAAPSSLLSVRCQAIEEEPPMRIGHGWDIHRLAPLQEAGQGCVIGGVTVENFDLGVVAHSDGDVLYHSATDAILGALTLPDIGQFFPDTDPRWKGCDSEKFLDEAWRQMDNRGYMISNLDVTLVLQVEQQSLFAARIKAWRLGLSPAASFSPAPSVRPMLTDSAAPPPRAAQSRLSMDAQSGAPPRGRAPRFFRDNGARRR